MALVKSVAGQVRESRVEAIANAVVSYSTRQEYVREIARLWQEAQEKFLIIGRYLLQAKETLPHGEFEVMVSTELPFGVAVARQLRAVAEAIDSGILPADRLPANYTSIYLLTTLSDQERAEAERQNLIRPDVRRQEIQAFKRTLRTHVLSRLPIRHRLAEERARLLAERERIESRLREIDAAMNNSDAALDLPPDEYQRID
jgi:hypothetical protein